MLALAAIGLFHGRLSEWQSLPLVPSDFLSMPGSIWIGRSFGEGAALSPFLSAYFSIKTLILPLSLLSSFSGH